MKATRLFGVMVLFLAYFVVNNIVFAAELDQLTTRVSQNEVDIATNKRDIQANKGQIISNTCGITENRNQINRLESRVGNLEERMGELDDRINDVGAMGMAASSLRFPINGDDKKFALAVGMGAYRDAGALAFGAGFSPTENVLLNVSVSTTFRGETGYGAGLAIAF